MNCKIDEQNKFSLHTDFVLVCIGIVWCSKRAYSERNVRNTKQLFIVLLKVSHLFLVKVVLLNEMLNLQNGSEEQKMPNIHRWICAIMSHFRFHIPLHRKRVCQCLPRICQFYNGVSILNIKQSLRNEGLPFTNVKN